MGKLAFVLACSVCTCHGHRTLTGTASSLQSMDEAPNSAESLASLLLSFNAPSNNPVAAAKSRASGEHAHLEAPALGRRELFNVGLAAASALLAAEPALALPDRIPFIPSFFFPKEADDKANPYNDNWTYKFTQAVNPKDDKRFDDRELESPYLNFTSTGLGYLTIEDGFGPKPTMGETVTVHFKGYTIYGRRFDMSYYKEPFTFKIGSDKVIKGWNEALLDMKEGEKRLLKIPPLLAYGPQGVPPYIVPMCTIVYYLELCKVGEGPLPKTPS